MTEYTLKNTELVEAAESAEGRRPRSSHTAVWTLRLLATLLLVVWSGKWLPPMFAAVSADTAFGQQGLPGLRHGYEVFELLFVAGHYGIRWLPGVALALGLFWLSGRLRTRVRR